MMNAILRKTKLFMDTVVDIEAVVQHADREAEAAIDRAFDAFRKVEQACSRFSPDSELMAACQRIGEPVRISPYLFEPLKFALEVAKRTSGRLDPAVGKTMEELGFDRHYLTGAAVQSPSSDSASYRDIVLDELEQTVILRKPMVIDLGAVAKGFAIDLAARELKPFQGFVVNAGGDLYAGGVDEAGAKWKIGIRHPVHKELVIHTIEVSDEAVCTSGSYERRSTRSEGMHHIVNPITKRSPDELISCSVVAPYAMLADAFSTAAFVLGERSGSKFIEQNGLKGILITPELKICKTGGI
jgi:thiamine biosynthesis lipoprotein